VAVVALASIKGAPGVTTSAVALGSVWPAERAVMVVECDPAGGDIAARRGLAAEPNLVSLAAAVRRDRGHSAVRLADHCQQLDGGVRIVAGSAAPAEMRSAIGVVGSELHSLAADAGFDVLADCGRLPSGVAGPGEDTAGMPATPGLSVVRGADLLVVVSRGDLADLSHLEAWLPALRSLNARFVLLLVGRLSWQVEEVSSVLGVEVLCHLPDDPVGADAINGRPLRGGVARLPILRAARAAADRIVKRLPGASRERTDETAPVTSGLQAVAATGEASS
jgi:hypothetical protein